MTTYRRLLDQATDFVELGGHSTAPPVADRDDALAVVIERHAVLAALEAQVWALLGAGRASSTRSALHPDPVEAAAVLLAETITSTIGSEHPHPSLISTPRGAWGQAARAIRAATDLLSVHHDRTGLSRSPVADTLALDDARDAALARVAALALASASVQEALALRVGQTGIPWATVRTWLPGMQRISLAARELARVTMCIPPRPLPGIGLVAASVRTDGPALVELADRLARVRQRAWSLVSHHDRSVATLRDFATIGVALHAHAAAFHAGPAGPPSSLIARGRAWQALGSHLATLLTPVQRDDVVHADLTALAGLLPAVAPLNGSGRAHVVDHEHRQTGSVLNGAMALMAGVGEDNARAFTRIARSHALFVPARVLTGDEVTDQPALVRARLDGKLVPAPERHVREISDLYRRLRTESSPPGTRAAALSHRELATVGTPEAIGLENSACG